MSSTYCNHMCSLIIISKMSPTARTIFSHSEINISIPRPED
jgi:hypothetical protein